MKKNKSFVSKQIKLSLILLIAIPLFLNATVYRVNNRANVDADFTTLASAYAAAVSGDTLYLEGSATNYGSLTLSKQLTIIGSGYWLSENDSTQAYKESTKMSGLTFSNGSQGSVVEGLEVLYSYNYGATGITIQTNDITLRRNRIIVNVPLSGYACNGIRIAIICSNITIEQNWIEANAAGTGFGYGIYSALYLQNSHIRNNIIVCDSNDIAIYINTVNEAASLIIMNNAIMGDLVTSYSSHANNIMLWGNYTIGTGDLNSNNICDGTQYPNVNSNQQNVDMSTVFVDFASFIDNGFLLKTGSPAIGAGVGGADCGPFGTGTPYVLSGIPPIPAIFEVDMTQSIGTTELPVTVKAMSHN